MRNLKPLPVIAALLFTAALVLTVLGLGFSAIPVALIGLGVVELEKIGA